MAAAPLPSRRHPGLVRVTHWITALCFCALVITGAEILISHPRFYWGENGNVMTPALFQLPIPSSRGAVKTGYSFVMKDQNGWSRSLHFQSAWLLVFCGLAYLIHGLARGHFRSNLLPERGELNWRSIAPHLFWWRTPADSSVVGIYNVLQRLTYLAVVFAAVPLIIWTGLAMSPAFTSAFPWSVEVFGGHQSARLIHFLLTLFLLGFLAIHLIMVIRSGFVQLTRAMITGGDGPHESTIAPTLQPSQRDQQRA